MRKGAIAIIILSGVLLAQISITDTLGTRLLPECGLGITHLDNYLYIPAGKYGVRIYDISAPSTVSPAGEWKAGDEWESEIAVDAVAFVDLSGHKKLAVLYNSPYVMMRYLNLDASYTSPSVDATIYPDTHMLKGISIYQSLGKLLVAARFHNDNQGVLYVYDVSTGSTPHLMHTWWADSGKVMNDAVLLTSGEPCWIVVTLWDSTGTSGGSALQSFALYDDWSMEAGSTYALPSGCVPHRIAPGWADASGDMGFYVALGEDGVGAYKLDRRTGAISEVNTYDDANMEDIVDVARWGNRLFAADHCTTYSATAYALHIFELDTTTMAISTSVTPAHIHGRNGRAVWGDSSAVWVVADIPQGSDTTAGAR
ncbi:hypothetical protein J7K99_01595 [bacterium]|nr:hypothetical protein [bacterium]